MENKPYGWMGEDHDAHITDFHQLNAGGLQYLFGKWQRFRDLKPEDIPKGVRFIDATSIAGEHFIQIMDEDIY